MKFLFAYFAFVYLVLSFSVIFRDRPGEPWRAALYLFFGPLYEIYLNIKYGLTGRW